MDDSQHYDELPKGHARLVLREDDVTHIIQGPSEDVEQRLWQEVANDLGLSVNELADADNYPMPEVGEGLVPAEEFHDSSGV